VENSSVTKDGVAKDIALLVLGAVAGLLPWLLDKAGIEMPKPVYVGCLFLCVILVWWALASLDWLGRAPLIRGRNISLANVILAFIAIFILILAVFPSSLAPMPEPSDGVRVTEIKPISSGNPHLKYGLEVTIEAEKEIEPVGLLIQFDGEIDESSFVILPEHKYTNRNDPNKVKMPLHPDMVGLKWQSPAWKPHEPIVLRIFSADKIGLKRVIRDIPGW
jgi:hypothetical protein